MSVQHKVLIDTDLIGDDILTIILGSGLEGLELYGISAFGRKITSRERSMIVLALLEQLNMNKVKVAAGVNRPLIKPSRKGCDACHKPIVEFYHKYKSQYGKNKIAGQLSESNATEFIIQAIKNNPHKLKLLCLGPLTNLALAVSCEPEITDMVKELVIMGGVMNVSGNVSPVAESNIFTDPEAAKIVFDRFNNITMVGLDVTLKTILTEKMLSNINFDNSLVSDMAKRIILSCINEHKGRKDGISGMPLHDPLSLMAITNPELFKTVDCEVNIETAGIYTSGQTVCKPLNNKENCRKVRVAIDVNSQKAINLFIESLNKVFARN